MQRNARGKKGAAYDYDYLIYTLLTGKRGRTQGTPLSLVDRCVINILAAHTERYIQKIKRNKKVATVHTQTTDMCFV